MFIILLEVILTYAQLRIEIDHNSFDCWIIEYVYEHIVKEATNGWLESNVNELRQSAQIL